MLEIQTKTRKNGREEAWFKDILGRRVGTRVGIDMDRAAITNAKQMAWLANYYIELQNEQLDAGLGSNGQPMPPLSGRSFPVFDRTSGKPKFVERLYRGYQGKKASLGLKPMRDLRGPGIKGNMRDDVRINYVDDRIAKISITRKSSRDKALANERKAPWWGLSPASARKFAAAQASIFGGAMEDYLDSLGLVQAGSQMVTLARALNARRGQLRRMAA